MGNNFFLLSDKIICDEGLELTKQLVVAKSIHKN